MRISPRDAGRGEALVAPRDELGDRDLLVEGRHHDGDLGIGLVVVRHEQHDIGIRGGARGRHAGHGAGPTQPG